MDKFEKLQNLTEDDYRRVIRNERNKYPEDPDIEIIEYCHFKMGMPVARRVEEEVYLRRTDRYPHKVNVWVEETHCSTWEEYKKALIEAENTRYIETIIFKN